MVDAWLAPLKRYIEECRFKGFRAIVHIEGEPEFVLSKCQQLTWQLALDAYYVPSQVQQLQKLLGTEIPCFILNAFQGLNPNALGVAAACVPAGGVFILLSPTKEQWPLWPDPDYRRMSDASIQFVGPAHFLARCGHFFAQSTACFVIHEKGFRQGLLPEPQAIDKEEQSRALIKIERHLAGRSNRPLVVMADRGRSKSSLVGRFCAHWMQKKPCQIAVTAAQQSAVKTLFGQIAQGLSQEAGHLRYSAGQSYVAFYAPDSLPEQADILIVDEAAALPSSLLRDYCKRYKRIIFITTLAGYEGSGQGFALRFLPYLEAHYVCQKLYLKQPLRWALPDPLEVLVDDLLLLSVPKAPVDNQQAQQFIEYQQADLANNEPLLASLFSLLLDAHYQTSPDDLRILLDGQGLRIFCIKQGEQIIAAALLMQEGAFSAEWQQELLTGTRRLRGHLLPQILLADGFDLLSKQFYRVLRIAVKKPWQKQGFGSQLLTFIESQIKADFIGASFSLDVEVLRFWQKSGFFACRLGSRPETSTGLYATVVLKVLNNSAEKKLCAIRENFKNNIAYHLLTQNKQLSGQVAASLLSGLNYDLFLVDCQQAQRYCNKQRSFEQVSANLHRLALLMASRNFVVDTVFWKKLLLDGNWQELANDYNYAGRAAIELVLRQHLASFLTTIKGK